MPLYEVKTENDGTDHPHWQADGRVVNPVTVWAESEEEAREKVAESFPADVGWEITDVQVKDRPGGTHG